MTYYVEFSINHLHWTTLFPSTATPGAEAGYQGTGLGGTGPTAMMRY